MGSVSAAGSTASAGCLCYRTEGPYGRRGRLPAEPWHLLGSEQARGGWLRGAGGSWAGCPRDPRVVLCRSGCRRVAGGDQLPARLQRVGSGAACRYKEMAQSSCSRAQDEARALERVTLSWSFTDNFLPSASQEKAP